VGCKDQHPLACRQSWDVDCEEEYPDGWDLANMLQELASGLVPEVDHPLPTTFSVGMPDIPGA